MDVEDIRRAVDANFNIPPAGGGLMRGGHNLRLAFRHDCKNPKCQDQKCEVCKYSRHLECTTTFASKSDVAQLFISKCGGQIHVYVANHTGTPLSAAQMEELGLEGLELQLCFMDGRKYDELVRNNKGGDEAVITSKTTEGLEWLQARKVTSGPAARVADNTITMPFQNGTAVLPEVKLAKSSAALLGPKGPKHPPLRLRARAFKTDGGPVDIVEAVSEGFEVVTKRAMRDDKPANPFLSDPVSSLVGVGEAAIRKLFKLPTHKDFKADFMSDKEPFKDLKRGITRVGELRKLQQGVTDEEFAGRLRNHLAMDEDKYEHMKEQCRLALPSGPLLRTWFASLKAKHGLLFFVGEDPMTGPDMLQRKGDTIWKIVLGDLPGPQQQEIKQAINQLKELACPAWSLDGHPGWKHCPQDMLKPFEGILGSPLLSADDLQPPADPRPFRFEGGEAEGVSCPACFQSAEHNPLKRLFPMLEEPGKTVTTGTPLDETGMNNSMIPVNRKWAMPGRPYDDAMRPSAHSQAVSQRPPCPYGSNLPAIMHGGNGFPPQSPLMGHGDSGMAVANSESGVRPFAGQGSWQSGEMHGKGSMHDAVHSSSHTTWAFPASTGHPGSYLQPLTRAPDLAPKFPHNMAHLQEVGSRQSKRSRQLAPTSALELEQLAFLEHLLQSSDFGLESGELLDSTLPDFNSALSLETFNTHGMAATSMASSLSLGNPPPASPSLVMGQSQDGLSVQGLPTPQQYGNVAHQGHSSSTNAHGLSSSIGSAGGSSNEPLGNLSSILSNKQGRSAAGQAEEPGVDETDGWLAGSD